MPGVLWSSILRNDANIYILWFRYVWANSQLVWPMEHADVFFRLGWIMLKVHWLCPHCWQNLLTTALNCILGPYVYWNISTKDSSFWAESHFWSPSEAAECVIHLLLKELTFSHYSHTPTPMAWKLLFNFLD